MISVIMPVYNGAAYLAEAVDSVLAQTCRDFELIIIDDGSKDESAALIGRFSDPRIRFFRQENQGLAATLNRGIALAAGEYIARQDQDDISLPARFEKQLAFLQAHPGCALLGTRSEIWEGNRRTSRGHAHPADNHLLKFELLFDNPFVHSSVMIRKSALDKVGAYTTDPARQPPEDYELWSRVAREFEVANLPEPLLVYREFPGSMSRDAENPFLAKVVKISAENLSFCIGAGSPDEDMEALARLVHSQYSQVPDGSALSRMEQKLMLAASRLAADSRQESELRGRAASRLAAICAQFRRRGPVWDLLRKVKRILCAWSKR